MALFDHYEYDNLLYTDRECPTLKIRKIARSKYDRCTNRHVPRFDHYCGWLNQATGDEVKADYFIVLQYLSMRHFEIVGVLLLMSVMSVFLGIFLVFHLYITACNMTTNEFFKWRAVEKFHKKEKKRYQEALKDGKVKPVTKNGSAKTALADHSSDTDVGCTGPLSNATLKDGENSKEIFDPGLMPRNIYNKGVVANFMEILRPLSMRDEAILRQMKSLKQEADSVHTNTVNRSSMKSKNAN
eukprot:scaffold22587_cov70-Cyclotella_meneghiniana.AAC.3